MVIKSKFLSQIYGLILKTITIKRKKRVETMVEFMYGIQYIIILVIIHMTTQNIEPKTIYSSGISQSFSQVPLGYPFPYVSDSMNQSQYIIDRIRSQYPGIIFQEVSDQKSLINIYSNSTLLQGIVFNQVDFDHNQFNYSLFATDVVSQFDSGFYSKFEIELLSIFTEIKTGYQIESNITTIEFPYISSLFNINNILFIIYFPLFFLYSLQQLIILIVTEKKDKIKEAMKVMGLKESAYWLSNIIVQLTMNLILIVIMEVIAYSTGVFQYNSPIMIFIMFLLFSLTLTAIAFLLSTFMENPKSAGSASSIFVILGVGLSALYQFYLKSHIPSLKYLVFLISPCAFGEFLYGISNSQGQDKSLSWSSTEFIVPFAFMILDFIIYSIASWYSIEVYQADTGTSKGYLFFLNKDYWVSSSSSVARKKDSLLHNDENIQDSSDYGIVLENLTKEFKATPIGSNNNNEQLSQITNKNGMVRAVDDLSFQIKKDTIFALLGKNGAGKSTTISMLTGLLPPTSGDAYILGYSMKNQMDYIRDNLVGLCPQNNILYDSLTCAEHILLFARIRGIEDNEQLVDRYLGEVNLLDKKYICSNLLSGGQKRRLCLAIAFISEPPIVFLDECSSGLDPHARHQIWKLLQQKKQGKTIILTTHFMEEAEVLGETIAIMSHGKLRCLGTSLELKNKFGLGYTLSITFDNIVGNNNNTKNQLHLPFEKYLYSIFPDVIPLKLNHENLISNKEDLELSYSLSHKPNDVLSNFFSELEQNESKFNIKSISLTMKTLEEIFLKISEEDTFDFNNNNSTGNISTNNNNEILNLI